MKLKVFGIGVGALLLIMLTSLGGWALYNLMHNLVDVWLSNLGITDDFVKDLVILGGVIVTIIVLSLVGFVGGVTAKSAFKKMVE